MYMSQCYFISHHIKLQAVLGYIFRFSFFSPVTSKVTQLILQISNKKVFPFID